MPQSYATVTPSGGNVTLAGIDFGFNFDTVVNTRDATACGATNSSYPCQGSVRQFVINSNALGGEGASVAVRQRSARRIHIVPARRFRDQHFYDPGRYRGRGTEHRDTPAS